MWNKQIIPVLKKPGILSILRQWVHGLQGPYTDINNDTMVKQVSKFIYLGSEINSVGKINGEIAIKQNSSKFHKIKKKKLLNRNSRFSFGI